MKTLIIKDSERSTDSLVEALIVERLVKLTKTDTIRTIVDRGSADLSLRFLIPSNPTLNA